MTAPEVSVVLSWHEALNDRDINRLVELSHPDVEMDGPRGPTRGVAVLREWLVRANVRLLPLRLFHADEETVVVEEGAEWRSPETGEMVGDATVASMFVVRGGRVASVTRHDHLSRALREAGLDLSHEVALGPIAEVPATGAWVDDTDMEYRH